MKGIGRTVKRRRREAKTDYAARIHILKSSTPRIVVRRTNRYIMAELVKSNIAQDSVVVGASSKELISHGWPASLEGSLKSMPAAYLTGLLLSSKIKDEGRIIFDIGLQRNVKKGRLYAVLAGLIAGGLDIPHKKESLPEEKDLIRNVKTREAFMSLKEKLTHGRKGNKK